MCSDAKKVLDRRMMVRKEERAAEMRRAVARKDFSFLVEVRATLLR